MADYKTVFMFSGQGSQYYQMGRALYDHEPVFRARMRELDDVARELLGRSVVDALYDDGRGRGDAFTETALTHPAICMVELSLAELLLEQGIRPDLTLGSSLGSFAAAATAGFIDGEAALRTVIGQAQALESACEPGGMIAVLADPEIFAEPYLSQHSTMAGINFASHFVISAPATHLATIEAGLKQRSIMFQRLPVSLAFHSPWIDAAQTSFAEATAKLSIGSARLPMMCCEQAALVSSLPAEYFWRVTRNVIRFQEAVAELERTGCYRYIDVGPAGTLTTFLKYGLQRDSKSTLHSVLTPYGQDRKNLAALTAS